jgi:DNA-binding MurR/RpiR family transcriptional regulator
MNKKSNLANEFGILGTIRGSYGSMSAAKKKIAGYILKDPEKVTELSITAMADNCAVGEATVIRFCQSLRLKGFQDLKLSIARDLTPRMPEFGHDVHEADSFSEIADKIAYRSGGLFANTVSVLDMDKFEQTVKLLRDSERRLVCGAGHSGLSAMIAQYRFMRVGVNCEYHADPHFANMIAASLGKNDLFLCFSNSGSTKDMVECTSTAKEAGATTVIVTSFPKSPLARVADVVLQTAGSENPLFGGSFATQMSQQFVIHLLFVALTIELDSKGLEASFRTAKAVLNKLY